MSDSKAAETSAKRAAAAAANVASSAREIRDSAELQLESAERRTQLAAARNVLAADRTYTAWVRTGLAALAAGIGAKALLDGVVAGWLASAAATALLLFSGSCFVAGVWRALSHGAPPPHPGIRPIPRPFLFVMNGFLLLVTLAALVGSWLIRFRR
jgi:putative membrane protein